MRPASQLLLVLLIFAGGWSAWGRTAKRSDVYIAGFFPYGDGVENSYTGRGVMPSVKLALGHVNEHGKILANYRLHMWWNDTQVRVNKGYKILPLAAPAGGEPELDIVRKNC